jgi:hypothetical protein
MLSEQIDINFFFTEDAASYYGVDSALRMSEFQNFLRKFRNEEKDFRLWYLF